MTVLLVDAVDPTLPVSFLEAVFGRGESVAADSEFPFDLADWGIRASKSSQDPKWFLTTSPQRAKARKELLIDARTTPVVQAQAVMKIAMARGEWEQSQTHESLIPYLREESEEFIEAIESGDDGHMCKELGDVFLQVLFHAEIASRHGRFNFNDVAASFTEKMRSRSPYFFDGSTGIIAVEEQDRLWAEGKAREKASG